MDSLPVWPGEAVLCLGEECCGFPLSRGIRDQEGCLLFHGPPRFPPLPVTAPKRPKALKNIQMTTSRHDPSVCGFSRGGGAFTHVSSKTSFPFSTSSLSAHCRLPTEVLCFDREGERRGGGASFFFWLWKIEASFMTHVPCPPVKITPAVFQGCSIIGRAANENNGACGEETRQTKRGGRKRPPRRKYLQVYFIHIHHPFPSHQTLR